MNVDYATWSRRFIQQAELFVLGLEHSLEIVGGQPLPHRAISLPLPIRLYDKVQ